VSTPGRTLLEARQSFAAYDVLGYLLPGGVLFLAIVLFEYWARIVAPTLHTPVLTAATRLFASTPPNATWATELFFFVVALAAIYVAGHVVASVAALLVDRVYVAKAHGYPFRSLLGTNEVDPTQEFSRSFYRAMFFWVNLYLVTRYLSLRSGFLATEVLPLPLSELYPEGLIPRRLETGASCMGWLLLLMVALKLLVSTSASTSTDPASRFLRGRWGALITKWTVVGLRALALPARLLTGFFGKYLGSGEPLDEPTRIEFGRRLEGLLGFKPDAGSSSIYWYSALAVRHGPASLAEPAENWLRLYSFARNVACAFYLAFLYSYLFWYNQSDVLHEVAGPLKRALFTVPLVSLALAFTMLLRYYYLYVNYYNMYLIRAVVFLERPSK
jgi:hypothetical protein